MTKETLLSSFRVLDLCNEMGMLCGKILADLGADVIKVEKPGGDSARNVGPFYHDSSHPDKSLSWFAYNTSKRGITLNIESKQGQQLFRELVKSADFVLESFPPGYLAELGLGYTALKRINRKLIMTSITPFGQTGPYREFRTSDLIAMATGGQMYLNGDADRPPLRFSMEQTYPQVGAQAAAASMIALHCRQLTGAGQHVDVSIQECIVTTTFLATSYWDLLQINQRREGMRPMRGRVKLTQIYKCKDGYISWRIFVADQGSKTNAVVELMREWEEAEPELENKDFSGIDMNTMVQEELDRWDAGFARFFARHTKEELVREAVKRDIMLFPVNNPEDLLNNVQLKSRNFWIEVEHPELSTNLIYPGAPFISEEAPWRISRRAPLIGEHNREIYEAELGLTQEEVQKLKKQGVI